MLAPERSLCTYRSYIFFYHPFIILIENGGGQPQFLSCISHPLLFYYITRTLESFIDMHQMVIICYPCKSNRKGGGGRWASHPDDRWPFFCFLSILESLPPFSHWIFMMMREILICFFDVYIPPGLRTNLTTENVCGQYLQKEELACERNIQKAVPV